LKSDIPVFPLIISIRFLSVSIVTPRAIIDGKIADWRANAKGGDHRLAAQKEICSMFLFHHFPARSLPPPPLPLYFFPGRARSRFRATGTVSRNVTGYRMPDLLGRGTVIAGITTAAINKPP